MEISMVSSKIMGRQVVKNHIVILIGSAVKPMPLGLGYKAETIQAQVL